MDEDVLNNKGCLQAIRGELDKNGDGRQKMRFFYVMR